MELVLELLLTRARRDLGPELEQPGGRVPLLGPPRQLVARSQQVLVDRRVPVPLGVGQRHRDPGHRVQRARARAAAEVHAALLAAGVQPVLDPAPGAVADGEAGRLGQHRAVGVVAAQTAGQRPVRATELLVDGRLDDHVTRQLAAALDQASQRVQITGDASLHVHRPPPVEPAVVDLAVPVAVGPLAERRHHVDVPREQQRSPAAGPGQPTHDIRAARVLAPRPPRLVLDGAPHVVGAEDIGLEPEPVQECGDVLLTRPLLAVWRPVLAAERDQIAHKPEQIAAVCPQPRLVRVRGHRQRPDCGT